MRLPLNKIGEMTMGPIGGKKAITICILKILEEYSDYDHPLTQIDIINKLRENYDIEVARNAVGRNISLLCELGYDINTRADDSRGIYIRERAFDDTELLVLIDSVLSSRYIPSEDAGNLIKKLGELSNRHFRAKMPQILLYKEWIHQRNKDFFWNLEILSDAINKRKQVSFTYNRAQADGELHPMRDKKDTVHPYALVCTNGQYYLICSFLNYDNLRHYRVDRITDIEMLDKPARAITQIPGFKNGLSLAKYASQHNFMYGGKAEKITLKMRSSSAADVIDAFGSSAKMEEIDDEYIKITVYATLEGMRFWALQFGTVCEVLAPSELRAAVIEDIKEIGAKYGSK